jgi:two-component system, response regulator
MNGEYTETLLLVEDSPADAELTRRALRRQDPSTEVLVVGDGAEALDFLFGTGGYADRPGNRRPRLVLLDLKLPKVDGFEVLRRLRSAEETRAMPVVVLTSSAQDRDVSQSYALGCNSYVVKPVEAESFARAVAAVGTYWLQISRLPA